MYAAWRAKFDSNSTINSRENFIRSEKRILSAWTHKKKDIYPHKERANDCWIL